MFETLWNIFAVIGFVFVLGIVVLIAINWLMDRFDPLDMDNR